MLSLQKGNTKLSDIIAWRKDLMVKLAKHLNYTKYVHRLNEHDMKSVLECSSTSHIQTKCPPRIEIDKDEIINNVMSAYGLTKDQLDVPENKEIKHEIHKRISKKILEYDDVKSDIASIIFESLDISIRNRVMALECAPYVLQEPYALFQLVLYLVRRSDSNVLVEQNELSNDLNSTVPNENEDIHDYYSRYTDKLKALLSVGYKEAALSRGTYFIRSVCHNNSWRGILERENQVRQSNWFCSGITNTEESNIENFEKMASTVINTIRKSLDFQAWVVPTQIKDNIHANVANDVGVPTEPHCPWCSTVLKIQSKHKLDDCFQVSALMKSLSKQDSARDLAKLFGDITASGAIPRFNSKEQRFKPYNLQTTSTKSNNALIFNSEKHFGASNEAGLKFLELNNNALTALSFHNNTDRGNDLGNYIMLDSGCDRNVISDPSILRNICNIKPRNIQGVGSIVATQSGETVFGEALYLPAAKVNLISQSQLIDEGKFQIEYNISEDVYKVYNDLHSFIFHRKGGLYAMSKENIEWKTAQREFDETFAMAHANDQHNLTLPPHAKERAKRAEDLHIILGHPSDTVLEKAIDYDLADTNLTSADVRNMRRINGPCQGCSEGKTVQNVAGGNYHPATLPGEVIHIDLIQVPAGAKSSTSVIIAVDELSTYGMVKDIVSKSTTTLFHSLMHIVNWFKTKGAYTKRIRCDAENALKSLTPLLAHEGITLDNRPPGEHEKYAENRVRCIRAKMRAMESSMAFQLPMNLSIYLLKCANNLLNVVPTTRTGNRSPYTVMYEERPKPSSLPFGQTVMVTDPTPHSSYNNREARANAAIYLGMSETSSTSGYFLMLGTLTVKQRSITAAKCAPFGDHIATMLKPLHNDVSFSQEVPPAGRVVTLIDKENFVQENRSTQSLRHVDKGDKEENQEEQTSPEETSEALPSENEPLNTEQQVETGTSEETHDPTISASVPESKPEENSEKPHKVSRFGREYKTPAKMATAFLCTLSKDIERYGEPGLEAAKAEINQILKTGCLSPVHESEITNEEKHKALDCKLFIQSKRDGRTKARLVGGTGASSQDKGLYPDLSSPTVRYESVMLLLKAAAHNGQKVAVADIPGAYLHAKFTDLSLDAKPDARRFVKANGRLASLMADNHKHCKNAITKHGIIFLEIKRALYGLIESAKLWYCELSSMLIAQGFSQHECDPCIFSKPNQQFTIGVYVDDIIILYRRQQDLSWFLSLLEKTYGEPRAQMIGPIDYLNVTITRQNDGGMTISQKRYILAIAEKFPKYFSADTTSYPSTPYDAKLFEPLDTTPAEDPKTFTSVVMSLVYTCTRGRPDIFLGISFLCTHVQSPTKADEQKLKRICLYLMGTIDKVLLLTPSPELNLISWIDASYAIHQDAKGHSGVIITAGEKGGSPVFISSRKQKLVARSSTEAELIALHDGSPQVVWSRKFLEELGFAQRPVIIKQDNKSAMFMAEKGSGTFQRTKHMAVRYFGIKQLVDDGVAKLDFAPTDDMLADPLTKPVVGKKFLEWRDTILFDT